MIDPQKIFEILKNKQDDIAQHEIESYCKDSTHFPELRLAGYKPTQSSNAFSYGSGPSESDLKEASLFSFALAKQKLNCAALLLEKLGMDILYKASDLKENGFHFAAKCDNPHFREWFFRQLLSLGNYLPSKFVESINAITLSDQHVLTLSNIDRLTPEEILAWYRLGVNFELTGCKSGNFLHVLCDKNKPELLSAILPNLKPLMIQRNEKGKMPIHVAAGLQTVECLKLLGEAGSPLAVEDKKCHRPLHTAIAKGAVEAIRYLLQAETWVLIENQKVPYVNVSTAAMDTPLHLIVLYAKNYSETAFKEAVELLMSYGADPYLLNAKQQNAITLANEQLEGPKLSVFWEKVNARRPMHLFSQHSLFAHIQATVPSQMAQAVTTVLEQSLRVSNTQDALKTLEKQHLDMLKQRASQLYQDNPVALQSFLMMLDAITESHDTAQTQRGWVTSYLAHSQSAGSSLAPSTGGYPQGLHPRFQ